MEEWAKEREEIRTRMELNEARTKKNEELLAAIAAKLGVQPGETDSHETNGDHNSFRNRGHESWRKLEIPVFVGEDAFGWTHKLERYFNLKGVTDEERMQATMVALEGKALSWFQWWERCNPTPTWEGFKLAVIRRFHPSMIQNPFELLLSLKQIGTVEEFVDEFEKYVGALKEIDQDFARGIFLNGLKEEIQVEVRLYELTTLSAVIQKAILVKQKNWVLNKKTTNNYTRSNGFFLKQSIKQGCYR